MPTTTETWYILKYIDSIDRIYVTDAGNNLLYRLDDMTGAGQIEFDGGGTPFTGINDVYVVGP